MANFERWVGRTETHRDHIHAAPVASLAATLDVDDPGVELPPLWHWIYFTPKARASEIGPDGHAKRGGFLPPVPLPRRMWAGGRLEWRHALRVGDSVTRTSRIASFREKSGRSGSLVFVTVRHEIANDVGVALVEEHDIVYRDLPQPSDAPSVAQSAPSDESFSRQIVPDAVLLFRYSALTFNGHRIHYDRTYVTEGECYPGLIVHGPLIATLLVDLARRQISGMQATRFEFKAMHPIFDIHPFSVCGREVDAGRLALWARDHQGRLAMQAQLEYTT